MKDTPYELELLSGGEVVDIDREGAQIHVYHIEREQNRFKKSYRILLLLEVTEEDQQTLRAVLRRAQLDPPYHRGHV